MAPFRSRVGKKKGLVLPFACPFIALLRIKCKECQK